MTRLISTLLLLGACSSSASPGAVSSPKPAKPQSGAVERLLSATARDFSRNPRLLERVRASPHGFFRFVNVPFSEEVCERFRGELPAMASVNLHGDAHIEQYAVTTFGRGMTDFDDSTTGPAVLDLVRFGVSLRLASRARGWGEGREAYGEFLRGYRQALLRPEQLPEEPAVARRTRAGFARDRREFLAWAQGLMRPVDAELGALVREAVLGYAAALLEEDPSLPAEFFEQKAMGALRMGIGSALDEKYIVRVEGPTDDASDDEILEIKEIRDLSGISCIQNARSVDPLRILVGQSRIAYEPYPFLGYASFHGKTFWIHGWADNYAELEVETLPSAAELQEIAFDIGVQLGRGHTKQIATPLDGQLRRRQVELLDAHEATVLRVIAELSDATDRAWSRFRDEAEDPGGTEEGSER